MKLELKHLIPYLNHRLKGLIENEIETSDESIFGSLDVIESGIVEIAGVTIGTSFLNECVLFQSENGDGYLELKNIKPIFQPLSYITKEIEIDGEKFVPIEYLSEKSSYDTITDFLLHLFDFQDKPKQISMDCCPKWVFDKLCEWHFDIFSLIPENLAIDINTLK